MLDANDLPHELLLTTRQKTELRNAFDNNMSIDLKLSKAHICKIVQYEGFLRPLLSKLAGPLMKVAIPLPKYISAPLRITTAASAIDAGIQKKINGSGTKTLIILCEEIKDIIKMFKLLKILIFCLKGVTKTIKDETKEQTKRMIFEYEIRFFRRWFVRIFIIKKQNSKSWLWKKKRKSNCKRCIWKTMGFLMPPYILTNFQIQKLSEIEPRLNGVFSRDTLPKN